MIGFLLLGVCVVAETSLEVCYKRASDASDGVLDALRHPLTWWGVCLWAIQALAWIFALRDMPLQIAYPVNCLTYVTVPLAGWLVLREKLTRRHVLAALLIAAGVALVASRTA